MSRMNNHIKKYIDTLKTKNSFDMKKKEDVNTIVTIISNFFKESLNLVEFISSNKLSLKGSELIKHLINLFVAYTDLSEKLEHDKLFKKELIDKSIVTDAYYNDDDTGLTKLKVSVQITIDIINIMKKYSYKYPKKDLSSCIEYVRKVDVAKKYDLTKEYKKRKRTDKKSKSKKKDYESDSDYESSDDENCVEVYDNENEDDYTEEVEDYNHSDNDNDDSSSESSEKPKKKRKTEKKGTDDKKFIEYIYNRSNPSNTQEEITKYYNELPKNEKKEKLKHIKEIVEIGNNNKPMVFKIMELPLPIEQKNHILRNYNVLSSSRFPDNKLKTWFNGLMSIPFGLYKGTNLSSIKPKEVKSFLDNLQKVMDDAVYGNEDSKRYIIQLMGQQIRNPKCKGTVLGIWGPPGCGKTSLIKDGIAKAMDKPFVFVSLGGASDASFLEGHSYTYEGSIWGRIANGLITSKCMDPIFYFDELDKISKTHKGDEISNILVHLTDPAQNSHFRDKYFHGIDIDLSKATFIFSFNNPSNINPILLDRITMVETKYLMISQKVHISQNYLLPEITKDVGIERTDIVIDDNVIMELINSYTFEGGVRKLKSLLYMIVREINLANLLKSSIDINGKTQKVILPFVVKNEHIKYFLKNKFPIEHDKIHNEPKVGIINGLYASSDGSHGGILPIEILMTPTTKAYDVKATGNLQKVIKESTEVASTLAFNKLSKDAQDEYIKEWKDKPYGYHIHCPDGSNPKDGPSAGVALTVALYSILTNKKIKNDIGITGEINLQGKVCAIGGLENKLEGAKKAGVKLVLIPKENEKHLDKIKERNKTLIDDTFKVITIETIDEALNYSLVKK